jgi:C4-dicarboxylate transporter, DctQ subunit
METFLRIERAFHSFIVKFTMATASVCLLAIGSAIFVEVITRYVFGRSFGQIPENAIILFVWVAFLALPKVTSERRHIAITLVPELLARRPRARIALECVNHVLVLVFAAVFLYSGAANALTVKGSGVASQLPYVIPAWIFPLALPVGMVLLAYSSTRAFAVLLAGLLAGRSPKEMVETLDVARRETP